MSIAMQKRIIVLVPAFLFVFSHLSCGGETETPADGGEDARTDTAPDTPADPAEDVRLDEAGDTVEEETPPVQGPITFIVRSVSTETVYLDWQIMGNNTVEGSRTTGAAIMPVSYWPPFCMQDCTDFGPGDNCCIECLPPPSVRVLGPGEELTFEWDGRNVYEVDDSYCVCSCYRAAEVTPMAYFAGACVYHAYNCWGTEPCEPNADGIISYANVEGDPACAETPFDIPYAGTEVVIEVQ
jgi:hypothetical protein